MTQYPNCKLCLKEPADKKNSHIIPKFLCKGLFESTEPRHAFEVDKNGSGRKIQDTAKQNHILCTFCERRIEIIETLFAKIINEIHHYENFKDKFVLFRIGKQDYLESLEIDPTIYKLFIYSLVWRASISTLYEYATFNLSKDSEEKIRNFLNLNLSLTKNSLLERVKVNPEVPLYHNCIIKPKEKTTETRGVFSVISMSETAHAMLLVDFAIFFYTDENSIGQVLEKFSNKQNNRVIIALGETEPWQGLNQLYLSKMLNAKNVS